MAKAKDETGKAGSKGGSGNFKDDPKRASEAGKKGGEASQGGRASDEKAKTSGKGSR
jgi:uncharacterized protein